MSTRLVVTFSLPAGANTDKVPARTVAQAIANLCNTERPGVPIVVESAHWETRPVPGGNVPLYPASDRIEVPKNPATPL